MHSELERDLREVLSASARSVGEPPDLADRMITAARSGSGPRSGVTSTSAPTQPPGPRRFGIGGKRAWVPLAAAATTAAIVLGIGWLHRVDSNPSAGHSTAPGTTAHTNQSVHTNQAVAVAEVNRLLAATVTLPGAVQANQAPAPELADAPTMLGTENLVERHAWWTAPGTVTTALAYLRAHPPQGFRTADTGWTSYGSTELVDWADAAMDSTALSAAQLTVSVTETATGVAMRADAQAVWLPTRSADQSIPVDVDSVDVTILRPGVAAAPTVTRTLTGSAAHTLAAQINSLKAAAPGTYSCPMDRGFTDRLVFHTAGHPDVEAVVSVEGCRFVALSGSAPSLNLVGEGVDAAILKLVGLPARYGD